METLGSAAVGLKLFAIAQEAVGVTKIQALVARLGGKIIASVISSAPTPINPESKAGEFNPSTQPKTKKRHEAVDKEARLSH